MTIRDALKAVPGLVPLVRHLRRPGQLRAQRQYWEKRRHLLYYQEVIRLARKHCPRARNVLDVGSANSPFLLQFDWIAHKTTLDRSTAGRLPGCRNLRGDFMTYQFPRPFDLVVCLQVLEHLDNAASFARKLLTTGTIVIISVPYQWPKGYYAPHVQDPVDEQKVLDWTGRPWIEHVIVREQKGMPRLIAVFEGEPGPAL